MKLAQFGRLRTLHDLNPAPQKQVFADARHWHLIFYSSIMGVKEEDIKVEAESTEELEALDALEKEEKEFNKVRPVPLSSH